MPHCRAFGSGQCPLLQHPPQGWAEPCNNLISPFLLLSSCFLVSRENGKHLASRLSAFLTSGPSASTSFLSREWVLGAPVGLSGGPAHAFSPLVLPWFRNCDDDVCVTDLPVTGGWEVKASPPAWPPAPPLHRDQGPRVVSRPAGFFPLCLTPLFSAPSISPSLPLFSLLLFLSLHLF